MTYKQNQTNLGDAEKIPKTTYVTLETQIHNKKKSENALM